MIRKANVEDIPWLFWMYMHPDINPFLLYEQMDIEAFGAAIEPLISSGHIYIWGENIGMFKLVPMEFRTAHIVYLGGIGIDPTCAGQGHGTQMIQSIVHHCIDSGFKRIELSVADFNTKAIHLYKKAGFEVEGLMKKYTYLLSDDVYIDEHVMAYVV